METIEIMSTFEQQLEQIKLDLPVGTKILHNNKTIIEIKDVKKFNIENNPHFKAKGVCYNKYFLIMNGEVLYTKIK